jgi:hypothetical protein
VAKSSIGKNLACGIPCVASDPFLYSLIEIAPAMMTSYVRQLLITLCLSSLVWTGLTARASNDDFFLSESSAWEASEFSSEQERNAAQPVFTHFFSLYLLQAVEFRGTLTAFTNQVRHSALPPLMLRGRGAWFAHFHTTASPPVYS